MVKLLKPILIEKNNSIFHDACENTPSEKFSSFASHLIGQMMCYIPPKELAEMVDFAKEFALKNTDILGTAKVKE